MAGNRVKVFKTVNDQQSHILSKFHKIETSQLLQIIMSIKKSQAILKCFIDLKYGVWFTLGSEDETMFCDTKNVFQLNCRSKFSKH